MTEDQVKDVVKFLLAGYPTQRQRMTPEDARYMFGFYVAGLADLDGAATRNAIERLARTSRFIPTVAEIRAEVGVEHHGAQQPAVLAWGEVHRFMRLKGTYRQPGVDFHFADPLAAEVVRAIGWEDMCAGNPDHVRARFLDGYAQLAKQERAAAAASPGGINPALGAPRGDRLGGARELGQIVAALAPKEDGDA